MHDDDSSDDSSEDNDEDISEDEDDASKLEFIFSEISDLRVLEQSNDFRHTLTGTCITGTWKSEMQTVFDLEKINHTHWKSSAVVYSREHKAMSEDAKLQHENLISCVDQQGFDDRSLVANVGDSRAVISRGGKAFVVSRDHKPDRSDERQRIEDAGGFVMWAGTWRVGGVLAVSRAFGDKLFKQYVVADTEIQEEKICGRPLYFDTSPADPRVLDAMLPYFVSQYGSPHSRTHLYGWESDEAVEDDTIITSTSCANDDTIITPTARANHDATITPTPRALEQNASEPSSKTRASSQTRKKKHQPGNRRAKSVPYRNIPRTIDLQLQELQRGYLSDSLNNLLIVADTGKSRCLVLPKNCAEMSYPDQSHSTTFTSALSSHAASSNVIENVLHSFVAESDPQQQITYEDFDQIGKLGFGGIRTQMANAMSLLGLTYLKRKLRKIEVYLNKDAARFDKKKVKCYKCSELGHFARECTGKQLDSKARYSSFKLKELDKSEEPKALLSVDSMLNWSDHEGEDVENGAAQVYGMIAGAEDDDGSVIGDVTGDVTGDATGDVADDVSNAATEFALMGISSQDFGETFGSDEVFDPSAPSIFDSTPEDVEGIPLYDRFDKAVGMHVVPPPITGTFMPPSNRPDLDDTHPSSSKTNEPLASAPSSVDFKTVSETPVQQPSSTNDDSSFSFKENVKLPRNLCNKSGINSRSLCKRKSFGSKTCFVCGSKFHLIKDCDFYEKQLELHNKPMWNNVANIPSFVPKAASVPAGSRNRPTSVPAGSRNRPTSVPAGRPFSAGWKNHDARPMPRPTSGYFQHLSRPGYYNRMYRDEGRWGTAVKPSAVVVQDCMTSNKEKIGCFVKITGVNGLPSKLFTNEHNCVACNKGKQHKASYKAITAVSTISAPLQLLHMDLFGPTSIRSIDHKYYSLVVTDDFSSDHLGKFEGKADEGFLVRYAAHSKAYRGLGHEWYFDLDYLTDSLGYTRFKTNIHAGTQDDSDSECDEQASTTSHLKPCNKCERHLSQADLAASRNRVPAGKIDSAAGVSDGPTETSTPVFNLYPSPSDLANSMSSSLEIEDIHHLPDTDIFSSSSYDDDFGGNVTNLAPSVVVDSVPTKRVNTIHPQSQILGDLTSPVQTRGTLKKSKFGASALLCKRRCNNLLIRKYGSFSLLPDGKMLLGTKMDSEEQKRCQSAFLYGKIEEEVYVTQPKGFEDPHFPKHVYRVVKALYGLHQAPRAWYARLSTFLLKHNYRRGTIDKTLFIKKNYRDIITSSGLVDAFIFGATRTRPSWCDDFEVLMKGEFEMSAMGELTFFLGLQVKQKPDGIFISQDKYVQDMLKKFDMESVRPATTPFEASKPKSKDEPDDAVNVHLYRSMIGSLMYLTASRPDIQFAVTYSDSDYAGSYGDRKSTTGGCQFLGRRLISWQCKKQTIVATSSTEAEYVGCVTVVEFLLVALLVFTGRTIPTGLRLLRKAPAILATIDRTPYTITELLVRSQLQLDDDGGVEDLPIANIYLGMDNLGYPSEGKLTFHKNKFSPQWRFLVHTISHCLSTKSGSWDQFGSQLAIALICLTEGRRYNWSSYIFKGMVKVQGKLHHLTLRQSLRLSMTVHSHAHGIFTPPRPDNFYSSARDEQGPSSDPNIATSSRPHASPLDLFTSTNVEDETMGGSFHTSPPRSTQAPPAGTTSDGAEALDKLTALSSLVSTLVQKVNTQESELKAHKLLFKEVVGKLVKRVKLLEDKLKGRKRKFVLTDSDKEEDAELDVDPLIKLAKAAATAAAASAVPTGGSHEADIPPSSSIPSDSLLFRVACDYISASTTLTGLKDLSRDGPYNLSKNSTASSRTRRKSISLETDVQRVCHIVTFPE
ncbi:putative ribonuclease H-like domain-containing protein [Tanacetum coccineum]